MADRDPNTMTPGEAVMFWCAWLALIGFLYALAEWGPRSASQHDRPPALSDQQKCENRNGVWFAVKWGRICLKKDAVVETGE